jgi:hypothetical protein
LDPGKPVLEHATRQELTELPFDELREADTLAGRRRSAQEGLQVLADERHLRLGRHDVRPALGRVARRVLALEHLGLEERA